MRKFLLIIISIIAFTPVSAQKKSVLTVEAASSDPTLIVRGIEKEIASVDDAQWDKEDNAVFLFTPASGKQIKNSRKNLVALQVSREMKIIQVINPSLNGKKPVFDQVVDLSIPDGGYVLIGSDDNYVSRGYKKFLAENFKPGDVIKFRIDGKIATSNQIRDLQSAVSRPSIVLDNEPVTTTLASKLHISGQVKGLPGSGKAFITIRGGDVSADLKLDRKGYFKGNIGLSTGANYINIVYTEGDKTQESQSLIVFRRVPDTTSPDIILWIEQYPNAKELTDDNAVSDVLRKAKDAGFTSVGFDVKGPEGFVSYRKNDLSHSPYITGLSNPNKKIADTGFDLLESILTNAHRLGLKVYASFNFFVEGNVTTGDYGVLAQHKDWEEMVQRPEDKGRLLRVSESIVGQEAKSDKRLVLAFVNPANKEVQDFQLLRVEEVLKNYPVDGIVLDRCRYDNIYADFSNVTRNAFADYLKESGKQLENFPNDAFRIDDQGTLVQGKYFVDWVTFRSGVIKAFTTRVRELVDKYKASKNPALKMAAYVGSWYEIYYQNGVNWASSDFVYNDKLGFPESRIYSAAYNKTSYLKNLDFIMIGTYYKTGSEVKKYITLGNILTCGQLPLLGSMSLPDLKNEERSDVFKASVDESSGLMIFDLCYVNDWNVFMQQMKKTITIQKK